MVVYQLACHRGHSFEGWFNSSEACEREARSGRIECPRCASGDIRKLPSAPYVHTSSPSTAPAAEAPKAREPAMPAAEVVASIKAFLRANTQDVGRQFAEIARRIHRGEEASRGIRGVVSAEERDALREEGVATVTVPEELFPTGEELH